MNDLENEERYYIELYDSFNNKEKVYNSTSGVNSLYETTDDERVARGERAKGKNNPMYGTESPIKGEKFSEDYKKKYPKASSSSICVVCKGRCRTSSGYRWAYYTG